MNPEDTLDPTPGSVPGMIVGFIILTFMFISQVPQIFNYLKNRNSIGISFLTVYISTFGQLFGIVNAVLLNYGYLSTFCVRKEWGVCLPRILVVAQACMLGILYFTSMCLFLFFFFNNRDKTTKNDKKAAKTEENELSSPENSDEEENLDEENQKIEETLLLSVQNKQNAAGYTENDNSDPSTSIPAAETQLNQSINDKPVETKKNPEQILKKVKNFFKIGKRFARKVKKYVTLPLWIEYRVDVVAFLLFLLFAIVSLLISAYLLLETRVFGYSSQYTVLVAQIYGIAGTLVVFMQYTPQIIVTFLLFSAGNYSLISLSIMLPGAVVICLSYLTGGQNFTTWLPYMVAGLQQAVLWVMLAVFNVRDLSFWILKKIRKFQKKQNEKAEIKRKELEQPIDADD